MLNPNKKYQHFQSNMDYKSLNTQYFSIFRVTKVQAAMLQPKICYGWLKPIFFR